MNARRAVAKRSFGAMVHFQVGQKVHCIPAMENALLADMKADGYEYYAKVKWVPHDDPTQVKCPKRPMFSKYASGMSRFMIMVMLL